MPIGGKLVLKGGLKVTASGVEKKKKKKKKSEDALTEEQKKAQGISVMSNKTYEEEFALETAMTKTKKAPEILHGYTKKVKGKTAEERLDMRAAKKNVSSEKNTRGLLRSVVDRNLTKTRVVIFDSLNNIKGYRYELWCIARNSGTRYCMVHVDTPAETCREWNIQRQGDKYCTEIFEDLAGRFERPDARNKWDAPLFTVTPTLGEDPMNEQAAAIVIAATENQEVATAAAVAAGASAVAPAGKELNPTFATAKTGLSATNLLHEMDKATQLVLDQVNEAQAAAGSGAPGTIQFGNELPQLYLNRQIPLAELRRHKRMFLKLATSNVFNPVKDIQLAKRMFIDYLKGQVAAG